LEVPAGTISSIPNDPDFIATVKMYAVVEPILNELIASRPPAATSRFHPLSVLNLDGVLNGGETGFYVSLSDAATILSSNPHELNTNPTLALANSELSTWLDFMQAPTQSAPTTDDGVADISDAFHWAEQFLFNAGGITGNGNTAVVVMENVNLNPVSASSQEWLIGTDTNHDGRVDVDNDGQQDLQAVAMPDFSNLNDLPAGTSIEQYFAQFHDTTIV
jgi:hypothetical protein